EHRIKSRFKANDDLIFVTSSGKSPGYNNSRRALRSGLKKISLLDPNGERVGAHGLRHYYATTLLRRGVHFTVVSALLGHASPNITLACYEHVIEQLGAADVAAQVEAALGGRL